MLNKDQAIQNLVDIQKVFPTGFLAYGSALGAHRENDIIGHDLDTDYGVFDEDFDFIGINELVRMGFDIRFIFGMRHHGFEVALNRSGVKTDIMVIYKDDLTGKFWNCLWRNGGKNGMEDEIIHEYKPSVFSNRKTVELGGVQFTYFGVEYIEAVYGEDWLVPVVKWNWEKDHKCLKDNAE